jgi:hypothetical protein
MIISPKYKFVFCHIPKTGGTSVDFALRGYGLSCGKADLNFRSEEADKSGHSTLEDLRESNILSQEDFNSYFKFCFFRDPWARLVSSYEYRRSERWRLTHPERRLALIRSFKDWVKLTIAPKKNEFSWAQQFPWVRDKDGNLLADKIYQFENLHHDFDEIRKKLNLPEPKRDCSIEDTYLHKFNSCQYDHYSEYYDNETRELVGEYAREEIDYFGYNFKSRKPKANEWKGAKKKN